MVLKIGERAPLIKLAINGVSKLVEKFDESTYEYMVTVFSD